MLCFFADAQVPKAVKEWLSHSSMQGASASVVIREIPSGKVICNYQPDLKIVPASVAKLVSTATALEQFGENYCFPTKIEQDGKLNNGILNGNIYIHGSGDPTLGSHYIVSSAFMDQWITAIREAGIRKITGKVISDESVYDIEGVSSAWLKSDLGNYYAAGVHGVNIYDNQYTMTVSGGAPGSHPAILKTEPSMNDLKFHNYLINSRSSADDVYINGALYSNDRFLYGGVPAGKKSYSFKGDIPDPPLYAATQLMKALQEAGIAVEKGASTYRLESEKDAWEQGARRLIVTTYSPRLSEIVKVTNYRSVNLFADAMMKALGRDYERKNGEVISSFDCGVAMMRQYWKHKGIDADQVWMSDGSGLSPYDKLTGGFLADLLVYMDAKSLAKEAFFNSLPLAGKEGSVVRFLAGTPLAGKARMKSGSMNRVRSFAGYIDQKGKRYAVVCIANNYDCSGDEIRSEISRMLVSLFGN